MIITNNILDEKVPIEILPTRLDSAMNLYAKPDKDINEFWLMGEKYKNGIYSHNTALYFYGMTDRTPLQFDMTFPSNNRVKNDLLNVHYIKKELHDVGLTELKLDDGFVIRIYNVERITF